MIKLINGVYLKSGVYFTTGGLYQSNLSNQNYVDIKKTIKSTGKGYVSISTKLRNTCCFSTREELEGVCNVDKKYKQNKEDQQQDKVNSNLILESGELQKIKSLPVVCPLGLYLMEIYQPIHRKKENIIIALKFGERKLISGVVESVFCAITIFNDSLYFFDKAGEFVGNEAELLEYIKKIKNKIILNSIHSTEECFQKISDTFFNDSFQFKAIGINPKQTDKFKYSSEEVFFQKKALTTAEKIKFYDFNDKENKLKKLSIISGVSATLLSIMGYAGYSYYQSYKAEQAAIEAARLEALKPKVIPTVKFQTLDYMEKYCFKNLDDFSGNGKTWALKSLTCSPKGVVFSLNSSKDFGNYLINKNDFYEVYDIKSKDYNKFSFDPSAKNVKYTSPVKFIGIQETKVIKYSESDIRAYISFLTSIDNEDEGFNIKILVDKDKVKSWEISSTLSPMYLQEKYHLFNKLYISSIDLSVDQNSGIFNWKMVGSF